MKRNLLIVPALMVAAFFVTTEIAKAADISFSGQVLHRYEVNDEYLNALENKGFKVSGRNPQSNLVEIMELDQEIHPYFIGTQAHPEFKSRLGEPAPLFDGLMKAAVERLGKDES